MGIPKHAARSRRSAGKRHLCPDQLHILRIAAMNHRKSVTLLALVLATAVGAAPGRSTTPPAPSIATNDIAIVVPTSNPISNLSLSELRRIYMGERRYWKSGSAVVVLMRAHGSSEREVMLRVVFQMDDDQYEQYWVGK